MTARRKPLKVEWPANWRVSESFTWNGRHIEPGTELSIKGQRGRYRFVKHVIVVGTHEQRMSEWIDVIGGETRTRSAMARSFRPEQIKTVHRVNKTRANAT